ncbi:P-loop containing nucleoside triphosphate hydrolase protein [Tribonema minus]|uniref:P-loop containing nucleoside triphosphate hydrolase protein n=1 Tax=Tribonema minus TaxID=303371 RepID=A0A835ZEI6_9STRA|nr:P-loop containing nucleoside triphosphate hydrolase protein [Tribonema minus]
MLLQISLQPASGPRPEAQILLPPAVAGALGAGTLTVLATVVPDGALRPWRALEGWGVVTRDTRVVTPDAAFSVRFYDTAPADASPELAAVLRCHDADLITRLTARFERALAQDGGGGSRGAAAPPRLLLHGSAGVGKTSLVHALAAALRCRVVSVAAGRLAAAAGVDRDRALTRAAAFARACSAPRVVLLLDAADRLLPAAQGRVAATLGDADAALLNAFALLAGGSGAGGGASGGSGGGAGNSVFVVATTSCLPCLHPEARRCFEEELEVTPPSRQLRERILLDAVAAAAAMHGRLGLQWSAALTAAAPAAAAAAQGFAAGDLHAAASAAVLQLMHGSGGITSSPTPPSPSQHDATGAAAAEHALLRAVAAVQPAVALARGGGGGSGGDARAEAEVPRVRWADVVGLERAKAALQEMVVWPQQRPDTFARLGIAPAAGVLLFGPPGTGKTLLAKAAAAETGARFVELRASDVVRGAVGGSERAVARAFAAARELAPAIVFIDEFESFTARERALVLRGASAHVARPAPPALFADRAAGDGGAVGSRLASQLLLSMDELAAWRARRGGGADGGGNVVVLAATNSPESIDPAFLRPGRFDEVIYAGLPTAAARRAMLEAARAAAAAAGAPWHGGVDAAAVARRAHGFSGADVAGLVRGAAAATLQRAVTEAEPARLRSSSGGGGGGGDGGAGGGAAAAAGRDDGGGGSGDGGVGDSGAVGSSVEAVGIDTCPGSDGSGAAGGGGGAVADLVIDAACFEQALERANATSMHAARNVARYRAWAQRWSRRAHVADDADDADDGDDDFWQDSAAR